MAAADIIDASEVSKSAKAVFPRRAVTIASSGSNRLCRRYGRIPPIPTVVGLQPARFKEFSPGPETSTPRVLDRLGIR